MKLYDSEIEYLEVTKTPIYFLLDYIPQGVDVDFHIGFMPTAYGDSWYAVIASNQSAIYSDVHDFYAIRHIKNNTTLGINYNTKDEGFQEIDNINLRQRHDISVLGTQKKIIVDGKSIGFSIYPSVNENHNPFIIFNRIEGDRQTYGRLYYFKVEKNGVPQLDLIPVRIGNEGFLYDKINKRLYGESGTGIVMLGPDIE